MITFAAGYIAVWLAVGVYVVRLGVRQRVLERSIARLRQSAELETRNAA